MGYNDHLVIGNGSQAPQLAPDDVAHTTADALIDFVEYEGRRFVDLGQRGLER
jgi:hypothetical protein